MITLNQFYKAFEQIAYFPDARQRDAIGTPPDKPLFLVAAPGTGRTSCLAMRILKLIIVDGFEPETVLALAETADAALKLRSLIIRRSLQLSTLINKDRKITPARRRQVADLNISRIMTGTPNSLCAYLFRYYCDFKTSSDSPSYFPVDKYTSRMLLFKHGLLEEERYKDNALKHFLTKQIAAERQARYPDGALNQILQAVWQRRIQDQVKWPRFMRTGPRNQKEIRWQLNDIFDDYQNALAENRLIDDVLIKQEILEQLRSGHLQAFQNRIQAVLIDQYQETNLLHEALYFELARTSHSALTVAGDDDRSLLRSSGATVKLFIGFPERCLAVLKKKPRKIYLKTNYCATRPIIRFLNTYIRCDGAFQQIRFRPKPKMVPPSGALADVSDDLPVLGMFRDDPQSLAQSLSAFICQIFQKKGFLLPNGTRIQRTPRKSDVGDCSLLSPDPHEGNSPKRRMLGLLRQELEKNSIKMFNPWSDDLKTNAFVRVLSGLILKCLDRGVEINISADKLPPEAKITFQNWRRTASAYLNKSTSNQLKKFVAQWGKSYSSNAREESPPTMSVYELIYGLVQFLPGLIADPQGQVGFEISMRQLAACIRIARSSGQKQNDSTDTKISAEELLTGFLGPIACGAVDMDETVIQTFPRDYLNVLPICYARQSVAPVVIADVGSDFLTDHFSHASKRFPTQGGFAHAMEDLLRNKQPQWALPPKSKPGSGRDRAFDDLYRSFFTAFSRAREVLLLVGLNQTHPRPQRNAGMIIRNVATGWRRDEICEWKKKTPFIDIFHIICFVLPCSEKL